MAATIRVNSVELGYLNVRDQPQGNVLTTLPHNSIITCVEPEATALAKIGQKDQWLRIRLADGREAYTAAWYLMVEAGPPAAGGGTKVWVYSPEIGLLNIRSASSTDARILTTVQHNEPLTALEAATAVQAKLGQNGQWLTVQPASGQTGFAAAWYLASRSAPPPDPALAPPEGNKIPLANVQDTERQVALVWNRLGGRLQTLAGELGLDPGLAVAVWLVESGGRPFGPGGEMTIRFENHQFYKYWGNKSPDVFAQHFAFSDDKSWTGHRWRPTPHETWRDCHNGQNTEWEVLNFARTLDDTAAKLSISMGGPQIMGFNYAMLGYRSVQEMFDAFAASEGHQVTGFFNFLRKSNARAIPCLQSADFEGFAGIYNGGGQTAYYGNLIRQTYETFRRVRAAASAGVPRGAETVKPPVMVETDDFRKILGIGPKTTALLYEARVYTFRDLAILDEARLRALLGDAARRLRWIATWPVQARLASWDDWDMLQTFQKEIKG